MSPPRCLAAIVIMVLLGSARADTLGLKLPPGFAVSEYAGSDLANDIYTLTLDPKGRPVVSGRGFIRILADDNGDGKADRAIPFAAGPQDGAMGLFWEDGWLYVTGDGGLRRYPIDSSGDKATGPSELIRKMRTGGEHHAHAIRRGPDGWLYVLAGNTTGIDKAFVTESSSPVKDPVAGCLLRFSPDLKKTEVVADGFRNAYDFDFSPDGEVFTYDSDNERCVALPWYEPTRFYHVIPGGRHGWLAPQRGTFWRQPPYFADVVAPVTTLDRGSPTGCVCYRHVHFPEKYRGGFFLADWTFGKIYFVRLRRDGSTFTAEKEVFLQATGENGFAPTGLAVHPITGELFVSIGGRGTRGAVYRIRYPQAGPVDDQAVVALQPARRTLDLPIADIEKRIGSADPHARLQGLIAANRQRRDIDAKQLATMVHRAWNDPDRYVRQASARLLVGETKANTPGQRIVAGLARPDVAAALTLAAQRDLPLADRLAGVRIVQLALGDIGADTAKGSYGEGYTRRGMADPRIAPALRPLFPTGQADLDREIARTLAMVEDDDADFMTKVAERWTAASSPTEDIHYLAVLSRLTALRSAALTRQTADALLALDPKATAGKINRDSHWPLRIAEIHAALAKRDPKLNDMILTHPAFGRPDHAVFCRAAGFPRRQAAERFLDRAKAADFAWNAEIVNLVRELPAAQALPVLRRLWGEAGLEEAILPVLAKHADAADRDKFLFGLRSPQTATLRISLETSDGKVYQGLIIYEAVDSLILQTGPAVTIRLVDTQITARGYSDISLMPTGALDKLTDEEIADLLAYLRSLQ